MGLGSTARKLQALSDTAEELYRKLGEILDRVHAIEESIEDSSDRLAAMETQLARQEALLEALARDHDIDPDAIDLPSADEADESEE